jgi:hypothetical protein
MTTRDPRLWPFATDSIWNMPIGSEAVYIPAGIQPATAWGMTGDEDILILQPDAPLTAVFHNAAGWSKRSRCAPEGGALFTAPIPADFLVPHALPHTPNACAAILMPDGRTLKQTQPFHRCEPGGPCTSGYVFEDADLYGPGIGGAHGASKLSSIGGTLRLGELVPGGVIRHVLKVNVFGARNLWFDSAKAQNWRWPARSCDSYAGDPTSPIRYGGRNPTLRMGALLALHGNEDLDRLALETDPARILAQALQDYGAYVVDDTAWDVYGLCVEWSPAGLVYDEFAQAWGFSFNPESREAAWARDMDRIFTRLHVIDNNAPDRVGGGGAPRVALAPELRPMS